MMKIQNMLLTPNRYSRPQIPLRKVTRIVIHWVANPGSSAENNRNYFESLKQKKIYASAHYVIGLKGEVIRCVPDTEVAYHANSANSYSIGIENCHPDWEGEFNKDTYNSLVQLCVQLCMKYALDPEKALIRHYDVTKKLCPKYYVENPKAWQKLKQDVKEELQLMQAVKGLIAFGIKLDINVWGSVNTMNMKYAKIMVERIGSKFGAATYADTINLLVAKGCISSRQIWDQQKFDPRWCRALLIKVNEKLIKK